MVAKTPEFEQAVADSKKLTSKPDSTELLELYGMSSIPRPHLPIDPLLPVLCLADF
jgi:hypothetical protein